MLHDLIQNWWLLHARGLLALIFGAFLLFLAGTMHDPLGTTIALVGVMLMFILYLVCSGVLSLVAAFRSFGSRQRFWVVVVHGTLLLVLALSLFLSDKLTLTWLVWFTVANALGLGILELALARMVHRHIDATLLTIAGTVSFVASVALILARNAELPRIVSALGTYAILYGTVLIVFSLRLHGVSRRLHLLQMK